MFPGIIGKKIGMSQIFQEDGKAEAVTAVEASEAPDVRTS